MTTRFFKSALLVAMACTVAFTGCKPSKKTPHKVKQVVKEEPVAFSIDTLADNYRIGPKPGHTMIIETLIVYVTHKEQPGVGVAIKRANNNNSNTILPYIVNSNVYAYGGLVRITLNAGDVAVIDIADMVTTQPIKSRIIISGTEQKN